MRFTVRLTHANGEVLVREFEADSEATLRSRQAALPPVGSALFLEGSGHLAYLEQPEPTRRAVLALAAAVFGR